MFHRLLPAALIALFLICWARFPQAQQTSVPVVLTRLEMALTLDYDERTLEGAALLRVRNYTKHSVLRVPFQVNRLMTVTSVTDTANRALQFTQDVVRFTDWPTRQMNQVWVELAEPLPPSASVAVQLNWNGTVTGYTETGMLYVRERIDSAFTLLRSETGAFPVIAVPTQSANRSVPLENFDFDLRITVPSYEVVALGGELVARTVAGASTTYEYRGQDAPFVNIAIAPYALATRGGVRVYSLPEDSASAPLVLAAVERALAKLSEWFGPLGEKAALAIVEIPNGYGSQASLRAGIIQQAAAFRSKRGLGELYHELSHLWNAPTTDQPAPRWEEGLASFVESLLMEQLDSTAKVPEEAQKYVSSLLARFERDTANLHLAFVDYGRAGKTGFSYGVGFLMFSVLYETLGARSFNRVLGGFYQQYRTTGATTRQFADYIAKHAPHNMKPFLTDWLFTTGWYARLKAGQTLHDMALAYRAPR